MFYEQLSWLALALMSVALVAAAIMIRRWVDARRNLEQRVAELAILEETGRELAQAQLDVDALCQLMYANASRIADTTGFQLGLFDGDLYAIKLWVREGEQIPPRSFQLTPGSGVVGWLRSSKQPILVRDFLKEMDTLPAKPVYVSERPPRSALFVPLIAVDTVMGTMSLQSLQPNAYGESDLRVLLAMGNQAALAIQKAELYEAERKRVQQLETIGQVSRQVTATMDLDEVFDRTVGLIRDNFGYYHVAIYTADREREAVIIGASASTGDQDVAPEVDWNEGIVGSAAAQGQPVMVNDVERDTRYQCVAALEETRSELAVPLLMEDDLVGVLDVQSDRLDAFGPDDLFILETLGDQIALAIHEARLYEAEQRQAWFSTALLQVAEVASQVSDMDAVLATIVRLTPMLVGVERCGILLWDQATEAFVPAQTFGLRQDLRAAFEETRFQAQSVPAFDLVRLEQRPLIVNTASEGELLGSSLVEAFEIQEIAVLPLLAQGMLLGLMLVDYAGRTHAFSKDLVEMLMGIANQAGLVIQSARLVQSEQEEAYVSMALLQAAEAASQSSSLSETLGKIVRLTPMLVGVERSTIFLWDPDTVSFVPAQQYGLAEEPRSAFWRLRIPQEDELARKIMDGEPFFSSLLPAESEQLAPGSSEISCLVLPLTTKGEVVGAMTVDQPESAAYAMHRRMSILTGIASQAAMAVENDRLLQESAERERMQQELDVARRIQTSFLPERCPDIPGWDLAAVWRSAYQVGGDFYDFFPLAPRAGDGGSQAGRHGVVIADVAGKGVPAALFMALSRTLVRTGSIPGRAPHLAISRTNDLILADARSDLFVTLFYGILKPNSGQFEYVNAGHMPPLVVRSADGAVEELRTGGMALGVLPNLEFEQRAVRLLPGDVLVLYTDGVTEAQDVSQKMFGKNRLIDLVQLHRRLPAGELAQKIDETVAGFVRDAPQFDDFTLVVARRIAQ